MKPAIAFQRLEGFCLDSSVGEVLQAMYDKSLGSSTGFFDNRGQIGAVAIDKLPKTFLAEVLKPKDRFYFPSPVCLAVCRPILEEVDRNLSLRDIADMSDVAFPYDHGY
jgi:hypothetical protein